MALREETEKEKLFSLKLVTSGLQLKTGYFSQSVSGSIGVSAWRIEMVAYLPEKWQSMAGQPGAESAALKAVAWKLPGEENISNGRKLYERRRNDSAAIGQLEASNAFLANSIDNLKEAEWLKKPEAI